MKRILSIVVSISIFLSALSGSLAYLVSAADETANGSKTVELTQPPIRFEQASAEPGYVDMRDGRFILKGNNGSTDKTLYTKGLTGRNDLTDVTVKYVYRTTETGWNRDMLVIHTDSENPTPTYVFVIQGGKHTKATGGTQGFAAAIVKNNTYTTDDRLAAGTNQGALVSLINALPGNKTLATNTDYNVEVQVKDDTISAWVYAIDAEKPAEPLITYTDAGIAGSGDIAFGSRTATFAVSNITITDDAAGTDICTDYSPRLYNSDPYIGVVVGNTTTPLKTSGRVTSSSEGYKFIGTNFIGDPIAVMSGALPTADGKEFENFDLAFDYRPDVDGASSKLLFNSMGLSSSDYRLTLPGSGNQIELSENGSVIAAAEMALSLGVFYRVEVEKNDTEIKVWVYEKGSEKPAKPTVSYTANSMLGEGSVYFYAPAGAGFTVNNISLTYYEIQYADDDYEVLPSGSTKFGVSPFTFVSTSDPAGNYVSVRDGKYVMEGMNIKLNAAGTAETTGDVWVETEGITGKNLTDFTMKYLYEPSRNHWGTTEIIFRSTGAGQKRGNGYSFGIQDCMYPIDGTAQEAGHVAIWLGRDQEKAVSSTSTLDPAKITFIRDLPLTQAGRYYVEIEARGNNFKVWFYRTDDEKPAEPTLAYTDASNKYPEGDICFAVRNEGFGISEISLTDDATGEVIADNYSPDVYDAKTATMITLYNTNNLRSGRVQQVSNDTLHLTTQYAAAADIPDAHSYMKTGALPFKNGRFIKNFELGFVYNVSDTNDNQAQVVFNERDDAAGYRLVFNSKNAKTTVSLYKGDTLMTEENYILSAGADYQVILSRNEDVILVYIFKLGREKPAAPVLSAVDTAPLASGRIYFATDKGDFYLGNITLNVLDDASYVEPIYELDFENGTGDLKLSVGNGELVTEKGNTYYRLTRAEGSTAVNAYFGPRPVGNFTLNMHIRVLVSSNPRWDHVSIRFHADDANAKYYDAQIFAKGSDFAVSDSSLGYKSTTKKLGMSGPPEPPKKGQNESSNPCHSKDYGLYEDGDWHKVSIVCDGYFYSMYVDEKLYVTGTDPEHLFSKGGFILGGSNVEYEVDNIRIYTETYYDLGNDIINEGPTGTILEKNFEGADCNMDGLTLDSGNKDATVIMTEENGNHFLRLVGTNANSVNSSLRLIFGPSNVRNFDLNAKIRIKAGFDVRWSYLTVGFHGQDKGVTKYATWIDIGPKGSAVVIKDSEKGLGDNNVVASTGVLKDAAQTAFMPTDNRDYGLRSDGRWHDLHVSVRGYTYTLEIDGVEYFTYTDPDQNWEKGTTYLYAYGCHFDLDDLVYTNNSVYDPHPPKVNNLVFSSEGKTKWLGIHSVGATSGWEFGDTIKMPNNSTTTEIMEYNRAPVNELSDFEWQFEYRAGSKIWGRTMFLFHVDEKDVDYPAKLDTASAVSRMKNVFGISIMGTNVNQTTGKENIAGNMKNNAITALYPNSAKEFAVNPVAFTTDAETEENIPTKAAYYSLAGTDKIAPIDVSKWMTVQLRVIHNKIWLTVWQNDNEDATKKTTLFTIPYGAMDFIKAGDLAIANGDCPAYIRNMTIKAIGLSAPVLSDVGYPPTGDAGLPDAIVLLIVLSATVTLCAAFFLMKSRTVGADTANYRR